VIRAGLVAAAALAVGLTGYDAYGTYAPIGYRLATIAATLLGIAAVLVLGAGSWWPAAPGSRAGTGPTTEAEPAPGPPPEAESPPGTESLPAPEAPAPAPASTLRSRLETLSLAVGVVVGLITILKEMVAAVRALLG
jgi:hypothetical protein